MDYDRALGDLVAWADGTDGVRAVVLTGSAAEGRAHPLSDRDVELYVRDSGPVLADESWWRELGEVLAVEALENGDGHPTRLVYYVGGKLDLTVVPVAAIDEVTHDRPFVVLLDKDDATTGPRVETPGEWPPSAVEFDEAVNWGWAAALMMARSIVRDEPWSVKVRDHDLKEELLRIIEWDHRARHGADLDVRYLGTRMRTWMDPDVQDRLDTCWARFPLKEADDALRATMALFIDLATRTADALDLPPFPHGTALAEVERILAVGGLS